MGQKTGLARTAIPLESPASQYISAEVFLDAFLREYYDRLVVVGVTSPRLAIVLAAPVFWLACSGPPAGDDSDAQGASADGSPTDAATPDASPPATDAADAALLDAPPPDASPPSLVRVAYLADEITEGVNELFLTDTSGTAVSVRLNNPLTAGSRVLVPYEWSPNGDKLLFMEQLASEYTNAQLYVVDVSGPTPSSPIRLNGDLPPNTGCRVGSYAWSPNGAKVAYSADETAYGDFDIFVVDMTGASPGQGQVVNDPLPDDRGIGGYAWSPNSSQIVYRAEQVLGEGRGLHLVDVSGPSPSSPQRIDTGLGDVTEEGFKWAPDGSAIAFLEHHQQEVCHPEGGSSSCDELYWVDTSSPSPGPAVRLHGQLDDSVSILDFDWASDSSHVLYRTGWPPGGLSELYLVDVSGASPSAPVKVGCLGLGAEASVREPAIWSPDTFTVAYHVAPFPSEDPPDLYMTDISDTVPEASQKVNGDLVWDAIYGTTAASFSPDSSMIVYSADQETRARYELYVARLTDGMPGAAHKVSDPTLNMEVRVNSVYWSPNSQAILFLANDLQAAGLAIFVTDLSGPTPGIPIRANGPIQPLGDVLYTAVWDRHHQWSPDGGHIIYIADQDANEVFELYSVETAMLGVSTKINGALAPGGDVASFALAPQ